MARKKVKGKARRFPHRLNTLLLLGMASFSIAGFSVYHFVNAESQSEPVLMELDPNLGLKAQVEEFFTANDAPEMIPIIKCESRFRHYNKDGTVLKNKAGSSATGIAQILSSAHPDPKVLKVYNRRHNAKLAVDDFDITTVEGNLGYALALYEVRGTRDWECAKKFRFSS